MKSNINRIKVDGLFGLYSYDVPKKISFQDATILYGDNGVGKSTILNLVYHLLSAESSNGHRTSLLEMHYNYLEVTLSNGFVISSKKELDDRGRHYITLRIRGNEADIRWDFSGKREDGFIHNMVPIAHLYNRNKSDQVSDLEENYRGTEHESLYLNILEKIAPKMFMLNADRKLNSDLLADPDDEIQMRRLMRYENPESISEILQRSREIGLSQALSTASKWVNQKAFKGNNQGSTNVHSVYLDVAERIVSPVNKNGNEDGGKINLIDRLEKIKEKSISHAEYQLSTELSVDQFILALSQHDQDKYRLAQELLMPYVESLEKKLEAVDPVYKIVDDFIKSINSFLNHKNMVFSLDGGFEIYNMFKSKLEAAQLSSGEQQLILLFCYVITARDEPSVFIIDEPEISLNIKWQRKLVKALLDITKKSDVQFIFASHSMELLSQHMDKVVKLEGVSSEG